MQVNAADSDEALNFALLKLGDDINESIEVEPFVVDFEGVTFGFVPEDMGDNEVSYQQAAQRFYRTLRTWDGEDYET